MRFAHPAYLLFLAFSCGIVFFYVWAFKRRRRAWRGFAQNDLLTGSVSFGRKKVKAGLLGCSAFLLALALMRPQWGFQWAEAHRSGVDILLAMDTSKSMLANDFVPSRFERSKLAVKDFVRGLTGDRVGLIAFSGSAFLQCPLTVDYGGFLLSLEDLATDTIPRGGTDVGRAVRGALTAFEGGQKKYQVIVIISDGENHVGDALAAAEEAKRAGVVIHCIGVGTQEGELISVLRPTGEREFLKDSAGNVVKSRLDEALLQKIALTTGGSYIRATPVNFGLDTLYKEKISAMERREFEGTLVKRYQERFQIPLLLAVLLLLLEPFISDRSRAIPRSEPGSERGPGRGSAAIAMIVFILLCRAPVALAADSATMVRKGNKEYRQGQYREALDSYGAGLADEPDSDVLNFNAGAASYKVEEYPRSAQAFEKALLSGDRQNQAAARYNLGNAKFKMGMAQENTDVNKAVELVRQSLHHFRGAIEQDPSDADAKFNYELARQELKRLEEKKQQQQNQQQDQKEQQEKQQDQKEQQEKQEQQDQQNKENQQDQQQEKQDQNQQQNQEQNQPQNQKDEESGREQEGSPQEMSPEEARRLLEGYDEEKGLQYLLDDKKEHSEGSVLKDW